MNYTCKTCFLIKELSSDNFYIKNSSKTGFEYNCKLCASLSKKIFRKENKEKCKLQSKNYYNNNKEKVIVRTSNYNKINNLSVNARKRNRLKNDIVYYLRDLVSRAVGNAIKLTGNRKGGSILNYLPYTINELKEHLENLFAPWMNWNNQGKYNPKTWENSDLTTWTWQLDHIIPQSKLPYSSMTDDNFQKCWSLENLRPLSAKQNIKDGNRR